MLNLVDGHRAILTRFAPRVPWAFLCRVTGMSSWRIGGRRSSEPKDPSWKTAVPAATRNTSAARTATAESGNWVFPGRGRATLGVQAALGGSERFVLAGTIVAYYEYFSGAYEGPGFDVLIVRDLLTGRVLRRLPSGSPPPRFPHPEETEGFGPVVAIVLNPDGAVAWITAVHQPTEYAVLVADRRGVRDLTGYDPSVMPNSLRLHGITVSWQEHGRVMTAPLD
jgi:hypothetical protein